MPPLFLTPAADGARPTMQRPELPREVAPVADGSRRIHIVLGDKTRYCIANGKFCAAPADFVALTLQEPYTYSYAQDGPRIPPGTTHLILAGENSAKIFGIALGNRGWITTVAGARAVYTAHPIDCVDVQDYEHWDEDEDEDDADKGTGKDAAPTQRANLPFWFRADVDKLLGRRAWITPTPFAFNTFNLCELPIPAPTSTLYLDIETHPSSSTMQCLSIAIDDGPVLSQTVYNHAGQLVAPGAKLAAWLVRAFASATVVAHNATFDTLFLAHYHGIRPPDRIHDTMLMWHRLFAEADKSLAHLISYCTNQPYHKDQSGTFYPRSIAQQTRLLQYNARDVYTLRACYKFLRARWNPSMEQVTASHPDYLFAGYSGFPLDLHRRRAHQARLADDMAGLERMLSMLTGFDNFNPRSPKQVGEWLFACMGYKPVETTKSGEPSVNAASLYKLLIKHPRNIALTVLLQHRKVTKQLSMLDFTPLTNLGKR